MFRTQEKQFSSGKYVTSITSYFYSQCFVSDEHFENSLQNVALLEEEEEINQLTEFFSYEHFYVIYCKFWELDADHDLYIDQRDLTRHNDQGMSP